MKINDLVYGRFDINEPVLIELINSKPLQRLKGISQYGPPDEFYHFKGYSRYEHSIGVMLLLRKLGASIEEQTAGLIHDVSHTAFSHVIDWVLGDVKKEDYQDSIHERFINNSNIPSILKKHDLETNSVLNLDKHKLLERNAPDLCADRIDYTLREFNHSWNFNKLTLECLNALSTFNNKIVFNSLIPAKAFAINYLKCQTEHWGSPETVVRYHLLAKALKIALSNETIKINDFYFNDAHVLRKLKTSKNNEVNKIIKILSGRINYELTEENPEFKLKKKFRYVDPEFISNNKLCKLSLIDNEFNKLIEQERVNNEKGINLVLK